MERAVEGRCGGVRAVALGALGSALRASATHPSLTYRVHRCGRLTSMGRAMGYLSRYDRFITRLATASAPRRRLRRIHLILAPFLMAMILVGGSFEGLGWTGRTGVATRALIQVCLLAANPGSSADHASAQPRVSAGRISEHRFDEDASVGRPAKQQVALRAPTCLRRHRLSVFGEHHEQARR